MGRILHILIQLNLYIIHVLIFFIGLMGLIGLIGLIGLMGLMGLMGPIGPMGWAYGANGVFRKQAWPGMSPVEVFHLKRPSREKQSR